MSIATAIACAHCKKPLAWESLNGSAQRCPHCQRTMLVAAFPALVRPVDAAITPESVGDGNTSSCFYHPQKKAAGVCEACGRFLCSLCDVEFNGQHLCSSCIQAGAKKGRIKTLKTDQLLYDDVALGLAIAPLLLWPFTFITAPITLYVAIRYWNRPSSIIPRGKTRMILAILIAALQVLGWSILLIHLATR